MATKWLLDPTHSEITFKVKHLMISNVKGEFTTFNAEIAETQSSQRRSFFVLAFLSVLCVSAHSALKASTDSSKT